MFEKSIQKRLTRVSRFCYLRLGFTFTSEFISPSIKLCSMVDRSNLVIAVFNGQKSGTKNTVDYAKRKDVKVVNVLK